MFIYVFDKTLADILINSGFDIVKKDENKHVYVFVNKEGFANNYSLANNSGSYVISDTMTF